MVPRSASTDSVNGVPNFAVLCVTISLSPSRSASSGAIGAHRMPRPCLTAKLTIAGVAFSAANTTSPSFSRSASSTTMIMRPSRIRAHRLLDGQHDAPGVRRATRAAARPPDAPCVFDGVLIACLPIGRALPARRARYRAITSTSRFTRVPDS